MELPPELIKQLVDIANKNNDLMDGTTEPVKRIISQYEFVVAVWQDRSEPHGVGLHLVKGHQMLREVLASNQARMP
jgi:hypothetical protein